MHDLIIIGGGAAGASAAIYALGKQLNFVLIYEDLGGKSSWGQMLSGQDAEEQRSGSGTVNYFVNKVSAQPGRTIHDYVTEVSTTHDGFQVETRTHGPLLCKAVIVATGATPRALDVPGADDLVGRGLGYSITSHAPLVEDKDVAVIGSTLRTLRGVIEVARTAKSIYLIAPDGIGNSPLARAVRQSANVEIFEHYQIQQIIGKFHVQEVVVTGNGQTRGLGVDAAFVDLGLIPNSDIVRGITETDIDGFIRIDGQNATSVPGLFAAGDVTTGFGEQLLIAVGEGARAGLSAYDYLLTCSISEQTGAVVDAPGD